jgi:DNA-binding PadR family transcriptional regulator
VTQERADMNPRHAWLLLFLGAEPNTSPLDQVRVMKGLFLLSRTEGHPTQALYRFQPWDSGPVDAGVHRDLDALQLAGLLRVTRFPGLVRRLYELTDAGRSRFAALAAATPDAELAAVLAAKRRVSSGGLREMLAQLAAEYPEYAENGSRRVPTPAD